MLLYYTLTNPVNVQLLGLLFDIIGAYWLALGFTNKNPADIKAITYGSANQGLLSSFGMSGNLFISLYIQGIEAKIGLIVLILGFAIQAVGIIWLYKMPLAALIFAVLACYSFAKLIHHYLTEPNRIKNIHDRDERQYDKRLMKK